MATNDIPAWNPAHPRRAAREAIAVELGSHYCRDITDAGDMDRYVLDRRERLQQSIIDTFMRRCGEDMLDAIESELSEIQENTPREHELVVLSNMRGTSWQYRYDALHPFFVQVCADLRHRLVEARRGAEVSAAEEQPGS